MQAELRCEAKRKDTPLNTAQVKQAARIVSNLNDIDNLRANLDGPVTIQTAGGEWMINKGSKQYEKDAISNCLASIRGGLIRELAEIGVEEE